ncbi:MAG: alpha/beta hydrolase [Planctomycetes bacterium]|nr:alpha/beta hydrolase [Planctomycetota bacterium]
MPGLLTLLVVAGVLLVLLLAGVLVHGATHPPRHGAGYAVARGLPVDPGDLGLAFDSWQFDVPGACLPVWEIAGEPGAPALTAVLLHGWGQSRVDMLETARRWRTRAARVVAYDLRGHGDATGGSSRIGCGEERDLLVLLERLGPGPFVLVGFSMGATIAIRAAATAEAGDRIAGVVVRAIYDEISGSLPRRLRSRDLPARPMTDLALAWLAFRGIRPRSARTSAPALRCPLLVIHGTDDTIAPLGEAEALAAAAPNGTLHRVDGATHSDLERVGRAGQDEAIDAFLVRLRTPVEGSAQYERNSTSHSGGA